MSSDTINQTPALFQQHPRRPRIVALLKEYPEEYAPQIQSRLRAEGIRASVRLIGLVAREENLSRSVGRPVSGGKMNAVLELAKKLSSSEIAERLGCSVRLVDYYIAKDRATKRAQVLALSVNRLAPDEIAAQLGFPVGTVEALLEEAIRLSIVSLLKKDPKRSTIEVRDHLRRKGIKADETIIEATAEEMRRAARKRRAKKS